MKNSASKLVFLSLVVLSIIHVSKADLNCQATAPNSASDCYSRTTNKGDVCCYIAGLANYSNEQMCLSIPATTFTGESKIEYNGKAYSLSCANNQKTAILEKCDRYDAISETGCATGSSFTESCCYYLKPKTVNSTNQKVLNTDTGCYKLGTKYSGNINWAGLQLVCDGTYFTFSFSIVLFSFIFVFLL